MAPHTAQRTRGSEAQKVASGREASSGRGTGCPGSSRSRLHASGHLPLDHGQPQASPFRHNEVPAPSPAAMGPMIAPPAERSVRTGSRKLDCEGRNHLHPVADEVEDVARRHAGRVRASLVLRFALDNHAIRGLNDSESAKAGGNAGELRRRRLTCRHHRSFAAYRASAHQSPLHIDIEGCVRFGELVPAECSRG